VYWLAYLGKGLLALDDPERVGGHGGHYSREEGWFNASEETAVELDFEFAFEELVP
jgi:hypothetical protein